MNKNLEVAKTLVREGIEVGHRERIERLKASGVSSVLDYKEFRGVGYGWSVREVDILFKAGFTLFVGKAFLKKMRYAATLKGDLTCIRKERSWQGLVQYNGDVPDGILDKLDRLSTLQFHEHEHHDRGLDTINFFRGMQFLVTSTEPLPVKIVESQPRKVLPMVDPFLLVVKNQRGDVLLQVNTRGRILEINRHVASKELLLVGMWDMEKEIVL